MATKKENLPKKSATKDVKGKTEEKIDDRRGRDISTAGFAVAIASLFVNIFTLGIAAVVGLVLSIIGRVQTAKAGQPSTLALIGIIVSSVSMALTFLTFMLLAMLAIIAADTNRDGGNLDDSDDKPFYEYDYNRS